MSAMRKNPVQPIRRSSHHSNLDVSGFYSHAAQSLTPSNIVVTAGQIGTRANGSISLDRKEEIIQALSNLRRCLETAGAGINDVLKLTYFIAEYDPQYPIHKDPIRSFLGQHRPATTLVPVPKLAQPSIRFEIEATAAIPQNSQVNVDVVIVGGGLSGLQAAWTLQKEGGLKVAVLEARDRIGGKVWSRPDGESFCETGAAWINATSQHKVYSLAKRLRLDLVVQSTQGRVITETEESGRLKSFPYGKMEATDSDYDRAGAKEIQQLVDSIEDECQSLDLDNQDACRKLDKVTLEQWVMSTGCCKEALNTVEVGVRAMLGVEMADLSALYFLQYCRAGGGYKLMRSDQEGGGQYLRIRQGASSLVHGLADELDSGTIHLQSPVRKIEQCPGGRVRVTSARGIFECTRAIVSVPSPLYREIEFTPPLPPAQASVSTSAVLGHYSKLILIYQRPWWRDAGLCGLTLSSHGPYAVTRDTSVDENSHFSLTCFVVGAPARDWSSWSPQKRKDAILQQVKRLFSPSSRVEEPVRIVEQIWKAEPWSQGCPCPVLGPGLLSTVGREASIPFGQLHFVGTETSDTWKGYMEGALVSGERGAGEVLSRLSTARL